MFAQNLIRQRNDIMNDPVKSNMVNAIMTGDSQRGEQIAQNLCNGYGVSREEAVQRAKQYFNI